MFSSIGFRAVAFLVAFGASFGALLPSPAQAAENEFLTAFRIALCPQYAQGGTWMELSYRVGGSPQTVPLPILSTQIDFQQNIGTFNVMLPRIYAATPLHVEARCRNSVGSSRNSNTFSVSNCDFSKFSDRDFDGLPDNLEDSTCDGFYSPGDRSNLENVDTDGDGVRDLVEALSGTDPSNPGSSPRPFVFSSGPFDPDGDGNSNAVVWRPAFGMWFVRDFVYPDNHIAFQFGLPGDTPFVYSPAGHFSDVGIVRPWGTQLHWYFRGAGLERNTGQRDHVVSFGLFGDNIIPGPWQRAGVTNPAVARLFNNVWSFYIYQTDGTVKQSYWGGNGDVPKVQDYDGDGIFDIAVFRPSEQKVYVIRSTDGAGAIYEFGSGTGDHTVRGDVTGDGVDDIINWEPKTGMFQTLVSDRGFVGNRDLQRQGIDVHELQLGLYFVHLPLSWNRQQGLIHYTVVDHSTGMRYVRPYNDPYSDPVSIQWGLPGDSQG